MKLDLDWKKEAAQVLNDQDVEKAFCDLATGIVENKAGDLMRDPYRIGFEIVKKDDDNKHMLGFFAFKVDSHLIFAPAFFSNGICKVPLLYRCSLKKFVPANKEWANYLIESSSASEGRGRNRDQRFNAMPRMNLQRLIRPEGLAKFSSLNEMNTEDLLKVATEEFEKLSSSVDTSVLDYIGGSGLIKSLLEELPGDKKEAAYDMIVKCATVSSLYAENLAVSYPDPEELAQAAFSKSAAENTVVEPCEELTLYTSLEDMDKEAVEKSMPEYATRGWYLRDSRDKEKTSIVMRDLISSYQTIGFPGIYSILDSNLKAHRVTVLTAAHPDRNDNSSLTNFPSVDGERKLGWKTLPTYYKGPGANYVTFGPVLPGIKDFIYIDEHGNIRTNAGIVYGIHVGDFKEEFQDESIYKKLPTVGKTYAAVGEGGKLYGIISPKDSREEDGITYMTARIAWNYLGRSCAVGEDADISLGYKDVSCALGNKLNRTNASIGIFGYKVRYLELNTAPCEWDSSAKIVKPIEFPFASEDIMQDWMLGQDTTMHRVTLEALEQDGEERKYRISSSGKKSPVLKSAEVLVKLANDCYIHKDNVMDLMDMANDFTTVDFLLFPNLEKVATNLRLAERPYFDEEYDSEFGVPIIPHRKFVLRTSADQTMNPPPQIGDHFTAGTATGLPTSMVTSTEPEDLEAVAETYKLPHVFEHGVFSTLADTFDAGAMVESYLPKMEDGLDAICRTLFLILHCPKDFERDYGTDDMINLEAQVTAEMDSLGALVMKLMKKSGQGNTSNMIEEKGQENIV